MSNPSNLQKNRKSTLFHLLFTLSVATLSLITYFSCLISNMLCLPSPPPLFFYHPPSFIFYLLCLCPMSSYMSLVISGLHVSFCILCPISHFRFHLLHHICLMSHKSSFLPNVLCHITSHVSLSLMSILMVSKISTLLYHLSF